MAAAIWCIILLNRGVGAHYDTLKVTAVEVDVVDSSRTNNLITSQMVLDMVVPSKIVGAKLKDIDLTKLESRIAQNGFIENVRVYCEYNGVLRVEVTQRHALARLMVDGYNCYIDRHGVIFPAPTTTVLYAQVVTGNYPLQIPRDYMGSIDDYMLERLEKIADEIEVIERDRYPIFVRQRKNYDDWRDLRKRYTSKRTFESRENYVKRYTELKRANQRLREHYSYDQREIAKDMAAVDARVAKKRAEQLKLLEHYDNIHKLLSFVEHLEQDRFWSKEVVQVITDRGERGEMRLAMSVRSGKFRVTLGELVSQHGQIAQRYPDALQTIEEQHNRLIDEAKSSVKSEHRIIAHYRAVEHRLVRRSIENKLDRVDYFYDDVLERVGWELYNDINVEFENQVVCRK